MYEETFTVAQLSYITGVPARTIRRWISKGMVPRAQRSGRYGGYTHAHIRRIREIVEIKDSNMTDADIRDRFNPYTGDDDE